MKRLPIVAAFIFLFNHALHADVVILSNGDTLHGKILDQSGGNLRFEHPALGVIQLSQTQLESAKKTEPKEKSPEQRKKGDFSEKRSLAANYSFSQGNSETAQAGLRFLYNRTRLWIDEWTIEGDARQEYAKDKRTLQQAKGNIRYGYSLTKPLYLFARFGAEHDYFENLNARLTPTAGPGYWFADTETAKFLVEGGPGYEFEFLRPSGRRSAPILQFRNMFMKKWRQRWEAGNDFSIFPHLNDFENFRIEEKAYLKFLVAEHWALELRLEDEYRSRPHLGAEKNDVRVLSGIEYNF